MGYVDGFAVPVPKVNLPAYRCMGREAGKVWPRTPRPRQRQGKDGPAAGEQMDLKALSFDAKRMFRDGFKVLVKI